MKKGKGIITMLSMAICAFAIAYAAEGNRLVVFALSWIIGMVACLLIQFMCSKESASKFKRIGISLVVAVAAGCGAYFVMLHA